MKGKLEVSPCQDQLLLICSLSSSSMWDTLYPTGATYRGLSPDGVFPESARRPFVHFCCPMDLSTSAR